MYRDRSRDRSCGSTPAAGGGRDGSAGKALGKFGGAHYMAIAPSGDIYVADTINAVLPVNEEVTARAHGSKVLIIAFPIDVTFGVTALTGPSSSRSRPTSSISVAAAESQSDRGQELGNAARRTDVGQHRRRGHRARWQHLDVRPLRDEQLSRGRQALADELGVQVQSQHRTGDGAVWRRTAHFPARDPRRS